jgi:hypothetical protein
MDDKTAGDYRPTGDSTATTATESATNNKPAGPTLQPTEDGKTSEPTSTTAAATENENEPPTTTDICCLIIRLQPPFAGKSKAWQLLRDNGPSIFAGEPFRYNILQLMQPYIRHPQNKLLTLEPTAEGGSLTDGVDDFRFADVVDGSETDFALRSWRNRPVLADRWIDLASAFRTAIVFLGAEAAGFRLFLPI